MKRFVALTAVVLGLVLTSTAQSADNTPESVVAFRHVVMESLGKHMGASKMIVKGEYNPSKEDMVAHASALHSASKTLVNLFPEGTGPKDLKKVEMEAKQDIWKDWDGFVAAAKTFEDESGKLLEAAEKGDVGAFKGQFGNVGKSCGGCHESFKEDDE